MYFVEKITQILEHLDSVVYDPLPLEYNSHSCDFEMSVFKTIDEDEVKTLILGAKTKYCILDPAPTRLGKRCIDVLKSLVTRIVNTSIRNGIFPSDWQISVITPLINKESLLPELKNDTPINNFPFLAKITERVPVKQLYKHLQLNMHNVFPIFQSAYRSHHMYRNSPYTFQV